MTFKKISIFLLLALPFVSAADSWICYRSYYNPRGTLVTTPITFDGSADDAFRQSVLYTPFLKNSSQSSEINYPVGNWGSVSNITTGVYYDETRNPYRLYYIKYLYSFSKFCIENGIDIMSFFETSEYVYLQANYYFKQFVADEFITRLYQRLTSDQLLKINIQLSAVQAISTDVSALVPLVASNRDVNTVIAFDFKSATTNAQYQRSEIINDLTTIIQNRLFNHTVDYDVPQIRDDIRALVSVNPSAPYSDNNALALEYFDLLGFDYSQDQDALVQAMINAGLATDNNDALGKLSSTTWRRNTLGPYVQAQRKKRDLIAQARQAGITHNFDGRSLDALANPELESLLQYSFNTPASSNAILNAHSLDALKQIDAEVTDAAGKLHDIDSKLEGPLAVNVMNWPDDWLSNSVSNALDGVFSGFLDGLTNFNPHYNFDDTDFFSRQLFNWRGFGLSALDQSAQNPVQADDIIGVTTFNFRPTGDYFQDVPNLLAMQAMQGADLANIFASVAIHIQSNAVESANTDAEMEQYKEDLTEMANSAFSEFQGLLHYSNILQNVEFTDTKDLLSLPEGFRTFEGQWEIPEYVNIQMPSWDFADPTQPPKRGGEDPQQAYTLTIDTAQYRQFFQNVRYVSLTLYWGIGVLVIFFLFRLFKAFISWIPAGLTGDVPHDYKL